MDMLKAMMERQLEAQRTKHDFDATTLTLAGKIDFIRWNVLALEDELHEALGETGWKPWASSKHINVESYRAELIDAWHFLMNLMLVADMTPEMVFEMYNEKRAKNDKRQEEGYDGVTTKCLKCKRALDDPAVKCTYTATGYSYCLDFGEYLA